MTYHFHEETLQPELSLAASGVPIPIKTLTEWKAIGRQGGWEGEGTATRQSGWRRDRNREHKRWRMRQQGKRGSRGEREPMKVPNDTLTTLWGDRKESGGDQKVAPQKGMLIASKKGKREGAGREQRGERKSR